MKNMKKFGDVVVMSLLVSGLSANPLFAASVAISPSVKTSVSTQVPVSVSFVQMSRLATLYPQPGQSGSYNLVLTNVAPVITYFSDRPNRIVGQVGNENFLTDWAKGRNSFAKDTPNAVLTGAAREYLHAKPMQFVLTLSNPAYDANLGTMTYEAHVLQAGDQSTKRPIRLRYSTLFIDNACLSCVG